MPDKALPSATVYGPNDHAMRGKDLPREALQVVNTLKQGGYQAYIVGGGVRDTLLDLHPKDFDVATDATPEQAHELFRRSRLIGRRFRLLHVYFGRDFIEVATFRGHAPEEGHDKHHADDEGRVLRDNVYGNMAEDAVRRDFTINSMFFDPDANEVYDYVGGIDDLDEGYVRLIGDPETRYREDPVRMLRAVRFAVKLSFDIHPETEKPIPRLHELLANIPAARLFEEVLKLFHTTVAVETYHELRHLHLFQHLFPQTERALLSEDGQWVDALIESALANTQNRLSSGKSVTPAFMYAMFLWGPIRRHERAHKEAGISPVPALQKAQSEVLHQQIHSTAIPKRFRGGMTDIWSLQPQLDTPRGRRPLLVLEHPRFRAAYDFLCLRAEVGDADPEKAEWWTKFQEVDETTQQQMLADLPKGPRRRGRRRKPRDASANSQ